MTFGPSSSLERIGVSCFEETAVEEIAVPDSVRELCDGCFYRCESLRHVMFGSSSSLERIGDCCFGGLRLDGFRTPPSVTHNTKSIFSVRPHILVRAGISKSITLECELTEKIEDLKAKIDAKEGFKTTSLIFANRQLEDGKTLLDL